MTLYFAGHRRSRPIRICHWYDFACPYSYVTQGHVGVLMRLGLYPDALPLAVHNETEFSDPSSRCRDGESHRLLERAAADVGLTLRWPRRMPDTRDALRVAEWVRQYQPDRFESLSRDVFAAHFVFGDDVGDRDLIYVLADRVGVDLAGVRAAMADGTAEAAVGVSESAAKRRGATGPPAWLIGDRLMTAWQGRAEFERTVQRQLAVVEHAIARE
jgi:predicted DsbA family dithiol-disulfide isomerase